ncbi:MAG: chemotaxis protein CheX [Gammaproteobacteria bacterium]|nr:chemotaxis protein CheX [Gammaproteobacteria bacterium]MDH5594366.1 chemotaxis protein CheX [Gammaproteobacteria bacterium]
MDVKFINPVLNSVLNVLSTMAQLEVRPGKPSIKENTSAQGDVTGYMTMQSPQANGSMAITFSKPAILDITKRMLGESHEEINETILDMTGELANMAVGGAKNILIEQGYDFNMSLPSVLSGAEHDIKHLEQETPVIIMPFETDAGTFYVEACFKE